MNQFFTSRVLNPKFPRHEAQLNELRRMAHRQLADLERQASMVGRRSFPFGAFGPIFRVNSLLNFRGVAALLPRQRPTNLIF